MIRVRLVPVDTVAPGALPNLVITLKDGINVVGRGPTFGITDRRVSRRHAEILVSSETGTITYTQLGGNPAYLQAIDEADIVKMEPNSAGLLRDGDLISLIEGKYMYRVEVEMPKQNDKPAVRPTQDEDATQKDPFPAIAILPRVTSEADPNRESLSHSAVSKKRKLETFAAGLNGNKRIRLSDEAFLPPAMSASNTSAFEKSMSMSIATPHSEPMRLPSSASSLSSAGSLRNGSADSLVQSLLAAGVPLIDPSEIEIERSVGVGSCGEVFAAHWRGTKVAVKKIFRTLLHGGDLLKELRTEAEIMRQLRHPNVVLLIGLMDYSGPAGTLLSGTAQIAMVTEFMERGSLRSVLNDESISLNYRLILRMARDAAAGMNYLHSYSPPIIHRDLKSGNLLVDDAFHVKVTDFGLAKISNSANVSPSDDQYNTLCGTLPWTAPEVFSGKPYSRKADVYSFGIVLWELFTRREPFAELSANKAALIVGVTQEGLRPAIPPSVPPAAAKLMTECWHSDPNARPDFSEILRRIRRMEAELDEPPSAADAVLAKYGIAAAQPATHAMDSAHPPSGTIDKPSWELDYSELEFLQRIGEGASSVVFSAKFRGQVVAVKVFKETHDDGATIPLGDFGKELAVLSTLRSPRVVFFYGAGLSPRPMIVTELVPRGSLYDVMRATDGEATAQWNWELCLRLAIESAAAVHTLHCWRPQILHRDLKSANLLVDEHWGVKLADFVLARFKTSYGQRNRVLPNASQKDAQVSGATPRACTYVYAAPETYQGYEPTTKADVYSYGIILWELVTRTLTGSYQRPFSEYKHLRFDFQLIIQTAKHGLRPAMHPACPQPLSVLIAKCWHQDPAQRPEFSDILKELEQIKATYEAIVRGKK